MKQENNYNIKFIKTTGIIYALGLLSIFIYLIIEKSNSSGGGGNNGGGAMGIVIYGVALLLATIVLIILNYYFSKPKPNQKYLIFLPAIILLNVYTLSSILAMFWWGKLFLSEYQQIQYFELKLMTGVLLLIVGFFLIKYILSKSKWLKLKKGIILLPLLILVMKIAFNTVLRIFV